MIENGSRLFTFNPKIQTLKDSIWNREIREGK